MPKSQFEFGRRRGSGVHKNRLTWDDDAGPECAHVGPVVCLPDTANWAQSLHDAIGKLRKEAEERRNEFTRTDGVYDRLNRLEATVRCLLKSGSLVVPITTFGPEPFELIKELKVNVQFSDEEFTASFFDANVNAAGCNEQEAVENLKDLLISRFEFLSAQSTEKLGPSLAKQIAVLREFIRRKG